MIRLIVVHQIGCVVFAFLNNVLGFLHCSKFYFLFYYFMYSIGIRYIIYVLLILLRYNFFFLGLILQSNFQVIQPINGDPFIGSLETPVTSSPLIAWYLSNLPAYRTAVSPLLRGIEVGLAHGFLLVGPFVKTGPLRNTPYAGGAGSLAAAGLVVILSLCLTMYGIASFNEGEPSTAPGLTLTGRKKEPDQLQTADGWAKFTGGFFFGGISGVTWAYILLYVVNLPYFFK